MLSRSYRPLAFLGAFVAIVILGDRVLATALEYFVDHSQMRFSRMYRGDAAADILVLGDSRGVHTFHAPSLGEALDRKVFNLSYNGFSTEVIECEFADYLVHNPPPKMLILEISNFAGTPSALVNLKPYLKKSQKLSVLLQREDAYEYWGTVISHLYRMNCESFLRILAYERKSDQGWILTNRIGSDLLDSTRSSNAEIKLLGSSHEARNLAALQRILKLASEHHIETRLVIGPYLPEYHSQLKDWEEVVTLLEGACKNAAGAVTPIWNYSLALDNPEYFSDRIHLNRNGADALQKILVKDGFFEAGRVPPKSIPAP